jgi:hypothetical protein
MKIEDVETANIAVTKAKGSRRRERGVAIRPFYRRSNLHARGSAIF